MKTKSLKKEWEIQAEHQLPDNEFIGRCGEILQMELTERCSSQDSDTEEMLSIYASDEQWKKHPLMYELIKGDGLDEDLFELLFEQIFYVGDNKFKMHRTKEGEVVVQRFK